jgi:hypothetical protein
MNRGYTRVAFALIVAGALAALPTAAQSLGVITAEGSFRVDEATVTGNATLTDGVLVETSTVPSRLRLESGPLLRLSTNAKATVHADHLVLDAGLTEIASPGDYVIESAAYRISAEGPDASGQVYRAAADSIEVAAISGTLRVLDSRGIHIANVVAGGDVLSLAFQAGGAAPPSSFIGCLVRMEDVFVLYDQTTRITVELRGDQQRLEQEWGNRVQAIGTTEANAQSEVAAQVVNYTTLNRIGAGGCEPVAAAIGGELPATAAPTPGTPAPAPQPVPTGGGGMSAGTKVGIIAGIAAGAGAGAYLGTRSDSNDRSP